MRLVTKQSGRFTYLYAIKGYRTDDGKSTTKVVEKFGTIEELREKLNGADPIEWARARVAEMTALEKEENKKVVVEFDPKAYIQKGEQRSYNGGYLFLQKIYYELGLDYICKKIAKKHKLLKYDLNGILSMLIFTRILYPGSKRSSLDDDAGSSLSSRTARWSRCTGLCRFLRESSTRSRRMCTSAAGSSATAIRRWCTMT
jgi:hypothetical protein